MLSLPFAVGTAAAQQKPLGPVRLTIQPAAAPVPALRYTLLPELRDQTPGNAALLYHRAHTPELFSAHRRDADHHEKIVKMLELPLDEFRRGKGQVVLPGLALAEVDRAARREYCDWELTTGLRKHGLSLLLPDLQILREYASLLNLKARLELSEGKFDQALRTLQTGLAMSRHAADGPTLINALVGMAIAQIMLGRMEELIQQPGAPNLYWALSALPRPFIDLRRSLEGERIMLDSIFPGMRDALADPKATPVSAAQVQEMLGKLGGLAEETAGLRGKDWPSRLAMAAMVARAYPEARRLLISRGRTAEQVETMPMLQVVVLFEIHNYDRVYDDMLKWHALPYWEMRPALRRVEEQLKQERARGSIGTLLASLLLPAVSKVYNADVRLDRKIAVLRTVELLRLHAAAHGGKLPASLEAIKEAPVPVDPLTGKPFTYRAEGDRATLSGPPPEDEPPGPHNTIRYELTIKR